MMVIENMFDIGQEIYLKTDPNQDKRLVCQIAVLPMGLLYKVCMGTISSDHYEFEMSTEKQLIISQ